LKGHRQAPAFALTALLLCACEGGSLPPVGLQPDRQERIDPNTIALIERQMEQVRSHPQSGANYAELGMMYEANTLWDEARRAYAVAVELEPEETWWRFHLAVAMRTAGDLDGALGLFRELTARQPELAPVQQRLGEALTEAGDLEGAATAYQWVIELAAEQPHGYLGLGEVRLLERDFATARELLERAVALDPRYRASRYALGLAYRGLGLLDLAQAELALGVDAQTRYLADPLTSRIAAYAVNLPALRNRAAVELNNGRADQAALVLEQVLREQPGNATDLNNLAIAYMRLGRFEEAREKLEEARSIAPEKFTTRLNLASLATRTGDREAAVVHAREAVERGPNVARTHMTLAMAEAELGNLEQTAASLEQAVRLDARDPQLHGMLAETCARLGRQDCAEEQFLAVLALLPDSLTGLLNLGQLYLQQGRLEEAGEMLRRAKQLAPGNRRVAEFEKAYRDRSPGEKQ
jgi:tetratricopeptide (TPR) repeat protein